MSLTDPAATPDEAGTRSGVSRRAVLAVGAAGASTIALAACSKAATPDQTGGASTRAPSGGAASNSASSPASSSSGGAASGSGGAVLAKLSDVGVGSAIAAKGSDGGAILISRTGQDTVAAFSAICPHQGCTVADTFVCPCHGSTFDPKTGAHISGPAPTGLTTVPVSVSGQDIVAG